MCYSCGVCRRHGSRSGAVDDGFGALGENVGEADPEWLIMLSRAGREGGEADPVQGGEGEAVR